MLGLKVFQKLVSEGLLTGTLRKKKLLDKIFKIIFHYFRNRFFQGNQIMLLQDLKQEQVGGTYI